MENGFPHCRHAVQLPQDTQQHVVRLCDSPKLIGLKHVSPETCRTCYARDHMQESSQSSSTPRLAPCVYFGELRRPRVIDPENSEPTHICSHPDHGWTTLSRCEGCGDYLFSVITPQMPVAMVQSILAERPRTQPPGWWYWPNVRQAFRQSAVSALRRLESCPDGVAGRGIVIVGGGRYLASAYVTIRVLRLVGCGLPIQLWHLAGEMDEHVAAALGRLDVTCVDASAVVARYPFRLLERHWWAGWQLKPYAILHSPFREVLFLDADCYPVRDPTFIFDWPAYRDRGGVFWPDVASSVDMLSADKLAYFQLAPFDDAPTESGQLLIDKKLCWRELNLALFYNSHADITYNILWGDKDTFPIAWKQLGRQYARMWPTAVAVPQAILQFDHLGQVLFQHRCQDKFRLPGSEFDSTPQGARANQRNRQLAHEDFCFEALADFQAILGR